MSHLILRPTEIESGITGETEGGKFALCSCQANERPTRFIVFQLDRHDHWHLSCPHCGTSYCPQGACQAKEDDRGEPR